MKYKLLFDPSSMRTAIVLGALFACTVLPVAQAADGASLDAMRAQAWSLIREHRQQDEAGATRIFIGATLNKAWLREARVQIDSEPALRYQFNEREAQALNANGLHPLATLQLTPGTHRLRADLIARESTGKPDAARIAAQIDRTIEVAPGSTIALNLMDAGLLRAATIEVGTPDRYAAQTRAASYLDASGREFAAMLERDAPNLKPVAAGGAAISSAVQRYNSALDRLDTDPVDAMAALQALGSEKPVLGDTAADATNNAAALAVRDRANLTLAYQRLQRGDPDGARESFRAVRSPGPYANAATLGLGWSQLWPSSPGGAVQAPPALRPRSAADLAKTRQLTPFAAIDTVAAGNRSEDLRRALVPWTELIGRDPLDPAVQEGMLALPYALDHIGAHEQAQQRYQQAVGRLESTRSQLQAARRQVDDGSLLAALARRDAESGSGWSRLLVTQRDDQEAVPLRTLAASPAVATALSDYRAIELIDIETRALTKTGDAALTSGAEALLAQVQPMLAVATASLQQALRTELSRLDLETGRYLAEAHFALARSHDRLSMSDDAEALR